MVYRLTAATASARGIASPGAAASGSTTVGIRSKMVYIGFRAKVELGRGRPYRGQPGAHAERVRRRIRRNDTSAT